MRGNLLWMRCHRVRKNVSFCRDFASYYKTGCERCAALISVTKQELDDFLWEVSPQVQRKIRQGLKEMKSGKGISLKKFVKKYGLA